MPLDVGSDVLAIVQRVCDKALNVAKARATSSALGPKAGMVFRFCSGQLWSAAVH